MSEEKKRSDEVGGAGEPLMESSLIRLSHCHKDIFCFSVPDHCPSCGERLRGSSLQEAPVSLPSPFYNGHKTSCCLLVAPAHDNVQREFDGTSDLHTGISNTNGIVYNYTSEGMRRDASGWQHCISVPLVRPDMFHLVAQWDHYLECFSQAPLWDPAWQEFHQDDHNCFTFCLKFINSMLAVEGRSSLSKEAFTQNFILPRMRRVSKFTTVYQHIQRHRHYMVDRQEPDSGGPGEEPREDL